MRNRRGFTLVEIMIVVAIIALLAVIAIPNLLRARLSANDALAKSTVRAISTAAESYASDNNGEYPDAITALLSTDDGGTANPPYLNKNYTSGTHSGYEYELTPSENNTGYTITGAPAECNTTGTKNFTVTTGGVLTEALCGG